MRNDGIRETVVENNEVYCADYIEQLLMWRGLAAEHFARIAELEYQLEDWAEDYKARIAELEAENERFTVHSDIERQDDKSPNHTQIDTVVY